MARLGRSIRITLHLHRHMYSPFKIRGFTLNFSKFWVSTPKMKGWSRLSRLKFSFARRVKTLMETLIIFSSSSYLSQPSPQKSFCFYHFPPFPRPPQCKTEPNQSENLSHRSTLFAAAASSSCPSVQNFSKNPVDSVFVVMPLRVLTPPAHWLKDNCGTAGPRLVDWLGKGLVVARIVVTRWRHFLVWSIKQFLWKSLSILIVPHSSTDKVCRIEKIKGKFVARYLPLPLTGPSSDYACLHRRRQGLEWVLLGAATCAAACKKKKGRRKNPNSACFLPLAPRTGAIRIHL